MPVIRGAQMTVSRKSLLIVPAVLIGVAVVAWLSLQTDTISHEKSASMEMVVALSPMRDLVATCLRGGTPLPDCVTKFGPLTVEHQPDRSFALLADGTLIGMDYKRRVTIAMTPRMAGAELTWVCSASPHAAVFKGCEGDIAAL